MAIDTENGDEDLAIAQRWCASKGTGWTIGKMLGKGGTAPVFELNTPDGPRALKLYDAKFSTGKKGQIEQKRIDQQLTLKGHDCPFLVNIFEGGKAEGRLYLLMSRAPGTELEKRLADIPQNKIRAIVGQVAQAAIFLKSRNLCHRDIKAANIFISDDFERCTLLDISVVRDVSDPIGVGTDHEGQLPVVATARYSPPEYLFRLEDPSSELWQALTLYQLGALLHDLIMKEPLFENEYQRSAENRYRFAWIIATTDPVLQAADVDIDLMLIAKRALDKNWRRRLALSLEDFLSSAQTQQSHALQVLGLGVAPSPQSEPDSLPQRLHRVAEVAEDIKSRIVQYLIDKGVRPEHHAQPGTTDTCKSVTFSWEAPGNTPGSNPAQVEFQLVIQLLRKRQSNYIAQTVRIATSLDGRDMNKAVELPEVLDEPGSEQSLYQQAVAAFESLAVEITRADDLEYED